MSEENIQKEDLQDQPSSESGELDTAQAVEQKEKEAAPSDLGKSPEGDDDTAAKPKGAQKRIGELTHNWRDAQRERDYWRDMALKGVQQPQPEQKPAESPVTTLPPPTLESADYDEAKYQQEMAKWTQSNIEQAFKQREEKAHQAKQQESLAQRFQTFAEKAKTLSEEKPDYDALANNPDLPVNDAMRDILLSSEKGPELLYHLGSNPAEADRISRLDQTNAALELGRLEARLSMPQPKQTNAPNPIKPVGGGGDPATDTEANIDAWMERRNKQLYS